MRIIRKMAKQMRDEIDGAKEYAKLAVHYKPDNPTMAKTYYDMANDEMRHADMIHAEAVRQIEKQKAIAPPPEIMLTLWEDEHKDYIEAYGAAKNMIAMFAR